MMKGAILIHGWATGRNVWHRHWYSDLNMPMADMLTRNGYRVQILEMPGNYVQKDKDLKWYATYLGHVIRERTDLDSIAIIAHSMGGIVGREYIADRSDLFEEGRDRVSSLIMLSTPNHGTSVPYFDLVSGMITKVADMVIPWDEKQIKGEKHHYFMTTPCYRDIQLGSPYIVNLNGREPWPSVDQHVIWTNSDPISEPQHTCVLDTADNHLIDRVSVNHFNMCYRKEVVGHVEKILNGTCEVSGLQNYPGKEGCTDGGDHLWLPSPGMVTRTSINIWKCSRCDFVRYSHALPLNLICGNDGEGRRMHRWTRKGRFYRYKFRCSRCGEDIWYPALPTDDRS